MVKLLLKLLLPIAIKRLEKTIIKTDLLILEAQVMIKIRDLSDSEMEELCELIDHLEDKNNRNLLLMIEFNDKLNQLKGLNKS